MISRDNHRYLFASTHVSRYSASFRSAEALGLAAAFFCLVVFPGACLGESAVFARDVVGLNQPGNTT